MKGKNRLLAIIKNIAQGEYSGEIMELTRDEFPDEIRDLAEAVGLMMVKIEAREFYLEQLNERLRENVLKTVTATANALGARDVYTEGHGTRVGAYAERLAKRLGLDEDEVRTIRIAGILHDIGKIGCSDRVFTDENAALSEDLLREIRQHPISGFDILKELDFLGSALEYVSAHHERPDGSGYPYGLKADQIPFGASIISVADCFDAMTTTRPYRQGKTVDQALAILRKIAGTQLDQALVEAFIQEISENGPEFDLTGP